MRLKHFGQWFRPHEVYTELVGVFRAVIGIV